MNAYLVSSSLFGKNAAVNKKMAVSDKEGGGEDVRANVETDIV